MGTEVIKNYGNLELQLEKAKDNLKGLNENIRKIIGRDPENVYNTNRNEPKKRNSMPFDGKRGDERRKSDLGLGNLPKRRNMDTKSVFSRLSGPPIRDGDDYVKPRIFSRVIKEQPTRQEVVAAQGCDEQSRARNRRIFGSLLGTLQKFSQEESRLKPKEEKKAQIEKKLEEQASKEREKLRKEKQSLLSDRKRQQLEIKMIEMKLTKMKDLEAWEESKKPIANYIRTKSKPYVYYLPKKMNSKTEDKLKESKSSVEKQMAQKRQEVLNEIAVQEEHFKNEIKLLENEDVANATTGLMVKKEKHDRRAPEFDEQDDVQSDSQEHSDDQREDLRNFQIIIKNTEIKKEKPDTPAKIVRSMEVTTAIENDDSSRLVENLASHPLSAENLQITFANTNDAN